MLMNREDRQLLDQATVALVAHYNGFPAELTLKKCASIITKLSKKYPEK